MIGIFLVKNGAKAVDGVMVVALAGAVTGGGAVAGVWAMGMVGAVAGGGAGMVGAMAGAGAGALAMAVAGVMAVGVAWAVGMAWAVVGAKKKLRESFSKFHTFLIVLGTSWLGLGLGWLLGSIFRLGT